MQFGMQEQFVQAHEMQSEGMNWADVYIGLRGASNPHELSGIAEETIMSFRRELGKVSAKRTKDTRWVLVRVPNSSFAQQAGMSTDEMMDFFLMLHCWIGLRKPKGMMKYANSCSRLKMSEFYQKIRTLLSQPKEGNM